VSDEENNNLMLTFSGEDMDKVLASMKTNTAPGPDGFPVFLFKSFWHLTRPLIFAIANGFALGRVDIARLNLGVLSPFPKVPRADDIRKFRTIPLINIIFKFAAKAYARLGCLRLPIELLAQPNRRLSGVGISMKGFWISRKSYMRPSPRNLGEFS
jgi:hypothetical protein